MSEERKRVVHPSWCDAEACTAPEFVPTTEDYQKKSRGSLGQHRSKSIVADPHRPSGGVVVYLSQQVAPWVCGTYLSFQMTEGEFPDVVSTQVGEAGQGFGLYRLLGLEVKEAVRQWPRLYAERFPYVQREIEDEADEATADAVMPRDPVELAEQMTAEAIEDEAEQGPPCGKCGALKGAHVAWASGHLFVTSEFAEDTTGSAERAPETQDVGDKQSVYRLTVNGNPKPYWTLREVAAAVAGLVTTRLGAEPERVAEEAQALNALFDSGAVAEALAERGDWFTVFDAYGEDPLRIRVTREREE